MASAVGGSSSSASSTSLPKVIFSFFMAFAGSGSRSSFSKKGRSRPRPGSPRGAARVWLRLARRARRKQGGRMPVTPRANSSSVQRFICEVHENRHRRLSRFGQDHHFQCAHGIGRGRGGGGARAPRGGGG